jgi:hypothetical protein
MGDLACEVTTELVFEVNPNIKLSNKVITVACTNLFNIIFSYFSNNMAFQFQGINEYASRTIVLLTMII